MQILILSICLAGAIALAVCLHVLDHLERKERKRDQIGRPWRSY